MAGLDHEAVSGLTFGFDEKAKTISVPVPAPNALLRRPRLLARGASAEQMEEDAANQQEDQGLGPQVRHRGDMGLSRVTRVVSHGE